MARLRRNHPSPLYIQLYENLLADIQVQRIKPHQQLPSERELCLRFGVSRMTVRQALIELTRAGLIYSRVGKGTFVNEPKIDQQLKSLTGFTQDVKMRGGTPSSRIIEARSQIATNDLANKLRVPAGTEIILLSRVRFDNDVPLAIETVHIPRHFCHNLLQHNFAVESLYAVLEHDYGYRLTRAEQTIEAALATSRDMVLLELVAPAAVLVMERLTFTAQDVLIEYVHSIYRADRYKFRSELVPRSEVQTV